MGSDPKAPPATRADATGDTDLKSPAGGVARVAPPTAMYGRFRVIDDLGEGGMGVVRLAHDPDLDRKVAIKVLRGTASSEARARLLREAQAMAKLAHPNVVTVFEVGVAGDEVFIAMELVDGGTLARWLGAAKRTRPEILDMFLAIGAGLAAAHEAGLVHRDFKPDNVLIGADGRPRVSDFGLVTTEGAVPGGSPAGSPLAASLTATGAVMGTPYYMAPEQFLGEPTDARTDQFAYCVALYEALYGERPFSGATLPALAHNVTSGNVRPKRPGSDVPDWLRGVLLRGLAVAPGARFPSMRALLAALRGDASVRRRRWIIALGAAAVVAAGGTAIVVARRTPTEAGPAAPATAPETPRTEAPGDNAALAAARSVASTNPALAIARAKPLAAAHWREVRAIAAEARLAGVPWSIPSPAPESLQLSRDGRHLLVSGAGGDVTLHDLDARTATSIATLGARASAVFADEERHVIAWTDKRVEIIDAATHARKAVDLAAPIVSLATVDATIYWASANGALWQMDITGSAPRSIAVPEAITGVAPSPDGRWLALAGARHAWLLDRLRPGDAPRDLVAEGGRVLDWSPDGSRLAVVTDASVLDVSMEGTPSVVHREPAAGRTMALATGQGVVIAGPASVDLASARGSHALSAIADPIDLAETRDDMLVAAARDRIVVLGEDRTSTIPSPDTKLRLVRASSASGYLVAAGDDRVLVWNLDDLVPRAIASGVALASFAGDDAVLLGQLDGRVRRVDLATGTTRDVGDWPPLKSVTAAPSGRVAIAIDAKHEAHVIEDGKLPVDIPGTVDDIGVPTETQIVLATEDGTIDLYDVAAARRTTLHARASTLVSLAANDGWVASQHADLAIWRMNLADRSEASVATRTTPTSGLAIARTGDVFVAIGTELMRWPVGGKELVHHATVARPITGIGVLDDEYLLTFAEDGTGYRLPLRRPDTIVELGTPENPGGGALAPLVGLRVVTAISSLELADPLIAAHWPLAKGWQYRRAKLSPHGKRVMAIDGNDLVLWQLDLPTNAAETVAWIDRLTGAGTSSR